MNTRQLMSLINNLDINDDNYIIWEEVYNQPYHIFLPIIERLIDGRMSIYDFVPRSGVLIKDYEAASNVDDIDRSADSIVARFMKKIETDDLKTMTIPDTYEDSYVRLNAIAKHNDANLDATRIKPELAEYLYKRVSRNTLSEDIRLVTLSTQEREYASNQGIPIKEMKKRKQLYSLAIIKQGL